MRNREEGEPPIENPGSQPAPSPPSGEGRRHSREADPPDVTAPSYPLLNFKPRAEEPPGGGGFLRSPGLLHAGDRSLPAPRGSPRCRGSRAAAPRTEREPAAAPGVAAGAAQGRGARARPREHAPPPRARRRWRRRRRQRGKSPSPRAPVSAASRRSASAALRPLLLAPAPGTGSAG